MSMKGMVVVVGDIISNDIEQGNYMGMEPTNNDPLKDPPR